MERGPIIIDFGVQNHYHESCHIHLCEITFDAPLPIKEEDIPDENLDEVKTPAIAGTPE